MKKLNLYLSRFLIAVMCISFTACSSDDDSSNGGSFNISQLTGSQWKRSFSYVDTDNGSWEKGECLLTFTNSNQAEEVITYQGEGWEWSYEDGDQYKFYSGTYTSFYTFQIKDKILIFNNEEYDDPIQMKISGNKMIGSNGVEYTLVKKGSSADEEKPSSSYSWANMQGVWMESDTYGAYAETIEAYKSQNAISNAYLNNSYDGDFGVPGYQFNASGNIKELYVCTKIWHNDNALILKTIYASDNKTVYWTDIENDTFSDKLIIRGEEIYQDGIARFEIINSKMISEKSSGIVYQKVK